MKMKKNFFAFYLSLALMSGAPFVMAQLPNATQGQNSSAQNLELQNLPIRRPIETFTSKEGESVQIMVSQLNSTEQLYYASIPTIKIDKKKCFDPQSKTFTIKVGFPSQTEEIRNLLISKGYNNSKLVQMPLVGYEIAVAYGNNRQVIEKFDGSVQILGSVSCPAEITNKAILKALNKDINNLNVEVKIICDFQKLFGSSAKIGFASNFKQKLHEKILAGKSEVYMSRDTFKQLTRDVNNEVQSSMYNNGYIIVVGEGIGDLMDEYIKQNPNLFVEKTMEEMGKLTESYWMYDLEFGQKEIKPDEISDVKNEWEKYDELKKELEKACKTLKEIRNQSNDIEDFKKRVIKSEGVTASAGGGFSFGPLSIGGSASGGGSYSSDRSSSHYTLSWKDLYDMSAQESFSKESFYSKAMEKFKGEVRKISCLPKDYKVMRVGDAELNSICNYYLQKSTIGISADSLTYKTSIDDVITNAEEAATKAREEAVLADLHNLSVQGRYAGERKTFIVNGVEFAFRWCPPGTFMMGSPESSWKKYIFANVRHMYDEKLHHVTLTKGFWMMETEVTQEQWQAVMGNNPSRHKGNKKLPVDCVSFNDCQEFCKKCQILGLPVHLPTEAQWEYACRAGTKGEYAGNVEEMAWWSGNSGKMTHQVGTKSSNAWGLYDMYGNVWEWCTDWLDHYPTEPQVDPTGPVTGRQYLKGQLSRGPLRVARGVCAHSNHSKDSYRSTSRGFNTDNTRDPIIGLRCVVMPK